MDKDLKKLIAETIEEFFENAPVKMIEKGVREETFDVCPHCKKEIYERHEYTEDGGKTWRHSECKGLIQRPPLPPEELEAWKKFLNPTLKEAIDIKSGEEKYREQEPGGQMAAVNTNEASFRVYNETLCPDLWDEYQHLDPEVRLNLLQMAKDFYEKTKFTAPILDVYLMGSIANYNWTPDSDADVHIIIDFTQLQMPDETASKVAKSAGAQWNSEHNAFVKGHKVEINIQSVKAEKPHVTGIYSLMKDAWIRKPTHMEVRLNKPLIQAKYAEVKKYLDKVIQGANYDQMKTAKDFLDDFRQYGLDTAGELSTENIVYKILRAKGLVKQLKDSITAAYDKEMSVDEANVSVAPDAKDYIGSIIDGEVRGEPVPVGKSRNYIHNEFPGLISGMNATNWRYQAARNLILWNTQPTDESKEAVEHFLSKRGITNARHKNMYTFEITQKQITNHPPLPAAIWKGDVNLHKMTLGNLKFMRDKARRMADAYKDNEDQSLMQRAVEDYLIYNDEIKRRLKFINAPVTEDKGEEEKTKQIMQHLPNMKPEDIQVVIQNDAEYPEGSYVQVDGIGQHDSVFSSNPERLIQLGLNIPDTKSFLKLPTGRYRLPDALKKLGLNESYHNDITYKAALDFQERQDTQTLEIADFLKHNPKDVRVPWKTVPASLLKKVWLVFGKYNRVDINGLDKIADQILTNIARLYVANGFQGHGNDIGFRENLEDQYDITFTDQEWDDNVWRFCDANGNDFLSDYGMEPLMKVYSVIYSADTPEEKLYACDKALNIVHQRNDLAAMFVEGGVRTLNAVAEQGGYDANYEYGQVNKMMRDLKESVLKEMPQMTVKDKTAFAGDTKLRDADIDTVMGNIVVFRMDQGGFFAPGYTLVYFMDSDESAKAMKEGKLPYLMIPRGSFHSGGNPITDVWKKKYQKPGTEHILGLIEGNSNEHQIYIDMISVRPGWKRNTIAAKMLQAIKKLYPNAKVGTSAKTNDGEKFFKKQGVDEGFGWGMHPERDRLAVPGHRWQIRSKDAPKTPKMKEELRGDELSGTPKPDAKVNLPSGRISFDDKRADLMKNTAPEIRNIVGDAERIFDKKHKQGFKFIDYQYAEEVFDDLYSIHVPHIPKTTIVYAKVKDAVLSLLAQDYDIRKDGKRIGESLDEADTKMVNDLVDEVIKAMV